MVMSTIEILQALMFFSFSASWYCSIAKLLRTKSANGKSLSFALMVCVGYGLGIASLVLAWQAGGQLNPLIYVFSWNLMVTIFDGLLVIRYSRASQVSVPPNLPPPMGKVMQPARD
jgi:hypothetical protein